MENHHQVVWKMRLLVVCELVWNYPYCVWKGYLGDISVELVVGPLDKGQPQYQKIG